MLRLVLLLLTLLAFASSSPARAYSLNPYQVVWPFEGHGADSVGGPVHSLTGQLTFSDPTYGPTLTFTAYLDGGPAPLSGFVDVTLTQDSIQGRGGGFYELVPGVPVGNVRISLGYNSVALSASAPDPAGFVLPPSHAPDATLFVQRQLVSYYEACYPIQSCQLKYDVDGFTITIDRFVDPVPEPAWLGLVGLVLVATRVRREKR